jgi:DNA-binding CsgD family transcriptional regulator
MGGWELQDVRRLLVNVVPQDVLTAYLHLLEVKQCPIDQAPGLLGGPDAVGALLDCGMAHRRPSGRTRMLTPNSPDIALQGALSALQRELLDRHERMVEGHQRLGDLKSLRARSSEDLNDLVEIITDRDEISGLSYSLMNEAARDWMTLENMLLESQLSDSSISVAPSCTIERVRCRSIYETAYTDHPAGVKMIEESVAAGEKARLLPKLSMKMKLADESVAMLPLTPTGMSGALLIRAPVITAALRQYFELLWDRAIPFGSGEPNPDLPLNSVDAGILRLMAQGHSDQTIAKRTGLAVGTVRRHIDAMKQSLDTKSRFVLAVAAVRQGWIE